MVTPASNSTAASALPAAGGTSEQTLSSYIGPYVTNMLGKAQAIANTPYQTYQGPQTAAASNLQNKVFEGLGSLAFPSQLGKTFSASDAYQLPDPNAAPGAAPTGPTGAAAQYMNPYLQAVLNPQLAELRRQNDITNMNTNAKMTQAGGYGGARQAIMNAENNRNFFNGGPFCFIKAATLERNDAA